MPTNAASTPQPCSKSCWRGRTDEHLRLPPDLLQLSEPDKTDLAARTNAAQFKAVTGTAINQKLNLIRAAGNTAVHKDQPIARHDALAVLRGLHHVMVWAAFHHSARHAAHRPGGGGAGAARPDRRRPHEFVSGMTLDNVLVRPHRRAVERFSRRDAWEDLSPEGAGEALKLAGLPSAARDLDEDAKRFDLLILRRQLAQVQDDAVTAEQVRETVQRMASSLLTRTTIPSVAAQAELLEAVAGDEWWADVTLPMLELARLRLRGLMGFVERSRRIPLYTDFEDTLTGAVEVSLPRVIPGTDPERLRAKATAYLREHEDNVALQRLRRNRQLTPDDARRAGADARRSRGQTPRTALRVAVYRPRPDGAGLRVPPARRGRLRSARTTWTASWRSCRTSAPPPWRTAKPPEASTGGLGSSSPSRRLPGVTEPTPPPTAAHGRGPGLFVAFEGGDGAGKSTQSRLLGEWLTGLGYAVRHTREPGGTALGRQVRELLLHGEDGSVSPRAEALLFAADRAHHVASVVRPALDRGEVVLSDRYLDSSVAYQGAARALGHEEVRELSLWAVEGLLPDLTVLLDVSPGEGRVRRGEVHDRLEREADDFHTRVRQGFLELAAREPARYVVLDATLPAEQLARQVRDRVGLLLPGRHEPVPVQGAR